VERVRDAGRHLQHLSRYPHSRLITLLLAGMLGLPPAE